MNLLLDQGNTRTRWVVMAGDHVAARGSFGEAGAEPHDGLAAWADRVSRVAVSSVADAGRRAALAGTLRRLGHREPCFLAAQAAAGGISSGYRDPARLGVDRWLAMLGARRLGSGPFLVVDAGTAMTLDAVDARGQHLGGYIVPGLRLQCRALEAGTARVGLSELEPVTEWGRDTAEAVANGVLLSLAALVDRALIELRRGVGDTCRLVLTGGDARRIAPVLQSGVPVVDEDLLFRGMLVQLAESTA